MPRIVGEVKWFNNIRGYGFLGYEGGSDVFIHYSAIDADGYKSLTAGDQVSFDIVEGERGKPEAAKVLRLKTETQSIPLNPAAN